MGTLQRGGVSKKLVLSLSLGSMFAGLGQQATSLLDKFRGSFGNDDIGNRSRGRMGSRYHNKHDTQAQTWDFHRRTRAGYGLFKNRTTGEICEKRIANPKWTKQNPARELSPAAQRHFGLTEV